MDRLAGLAQRAPRRMLAGAAVFFVVAAVLGGSVADHMLPYGADDPGTQSVQLRQDIERATGVQTDSGIIALVAAPGGVRSRAARARVGRVTAILRRDRDVGKVTSFYSSHDRALVARDGRWTYVAASFRALPDSAVQDAAERLNKRFDGMSGVRLGGRAVGFFEVNQTVESDLRRAELIAFPVLLVLSLLFFRSLVAALLPLLVGALGIVGTFLGLRVASELGDVSIFALNLVTGLGLGLAIDYSLFIVSRYREEMAAVGPGFEALRRTMATAGRTVLFSSLTVAAALASLLVFPQRFLYSMGIGGTMVALIAAGVALLVLPAVLALLGPRVNALAPRRLQRASQRDARPDEAGAWYRLSRFVMRRPAPVAVGSAAMLIALGIPFLSIKFTSVDASVLPRGSDARQVYETLRAEFPPNRDAPIVIGASVRQARAISRRVAALPGVDQVMPPRPGGHGKVVLWAFTPASPFSERAQSLVREIRRVPGTRVGGEAAEFLDRKDSLARHVPIALLIVAAATIVVLFLMTGSVILPIKALVMNVLTLSAAFGLLVLIFQDGRLEGPLAYTGQGALELTQPVLLFAVAFGLSTDYGVFLLGRIKEARDRGAGDREAVAIGLERTGRIVTAAALLFCVAIGAFATSQIIFIKELGVGTALAVLVDATLVRALLVPALMELLGRWNWWAPRPLRRLHARIGISEGGSGAAKVAA
jgi:putative drug exporter of the RND superfamily